MARRIHDITANLAEAKDTAYFECRQLCFLSASNATPDKRKLCKDFFSGAFLSRAWYWLGSWSTGINQLDAKENKATHCPMCQVQKFW